MKGNEKDCICHKPKNKHTKRCDAYRVSEFFKEAVAILTPISSMKTLICWIFGHKFNPEGKFIDGEENHWRCKRCKEHRWTRTI